MQPVRKAVITAAGMGTRFLPATKSIPKEMLPVVDRPAIQYVVEEAVQAGLTDILIITGRGKRAGGRPLRPQLRARTLPRHDRQARDAQGGAVRCPISPTSTTCVSATRSGSGTPCRWPGITSVTSRSRCCSPTTSWSTTRSCFARCWARTTIPALRPWRSRRSRRRRSRRTDVSSPRARRATVRSPFDGSSRSRRATLRRRTLR